MSRKNFKDLIVWQRAVDFVPVAYELLRQFPPEERFALGDQVRRAAVSVPANIAEGQARQHPKEFLHYLSIAKGSLAELQTLFIVAARLGYLREDQLSQVEEHIAEIARPLHGLISSIRV